MVALFQALGLYIRQFSLESCSSSSPGTMNSIIFVGGTFFQAPNYKFYNFRSFSSSGTINPTIFVGESFFFQALGQYINWQIFARGSLFFKLWVYAFDIFCWMVAFFQALGLYIQKFSLEGRSFSSSGTTNSTVFVQESLFFQALRLYIRQFSLEGRSFSSSGTTHSAILVGKPPLFKLWGYKLDRFRWRVALFQIQGV